MANVHQGAVEEAIKKRQEQLGEGPVVPADIGDIEKNPVVRGDRIMQNMPPGYRTAAPPLEQQPNYEKLSRFERSVLDWIPGFSEGSVGQALAKFGESPFGKVLQFLDVGAEALERATGFAAQALFASQNPDTWDAWTEEQRLHFVRDHNLEDNVSTRTLEMNSKELKSDNWGKEFGNRTSWDWIETTLKEHISEGQYAGGGRAANGAKVESSIDLWNNMSQKKREILLSKLPGGWSAKHSYQQYWELTPAIREEVDYYFNAKMSAAKGTKVAAPTNQRVWAQGEILESYPSDIGGSNMSVEHIIEYEGKKYIVNTNVDEDKVLYANQQAILQDDTAAKGGADS